MAYYFRRRNMSVEKQEQTDGNKTNSQQKLVVGMIVRNEEHRYLPKVLKSIQSYASEEVDLKLVIVDDASTDKTAQICESYPNTRVIRLKQRLFNKNESKLRTILWEEIRKEKSDWVIIQDADELFEKEFARRLPEFLNSHWHWISFHWLDMWNENHYRIDKHWSPCFTRLFKFRDKPFNALSIKIHCSCLPGYVLESNVGTCYSDIRVQHLGWMKDKDKITKQKWYAEKKADALDNFHMTTVFDPNPVLKEFKEPLELPNVLIGGLIRNRAWCLDDFLNGIKMQDYPKDKISFFWVVGDCTDSTIPDLNIWAEENKTKYRHIHICEMNFGRKDETEHEWPTKLLLRMGLMRNKYMEAVGDNERVFSIDSDVILKDKRTLKHLVCLDREAIAEVCWATWGKIDSLPLPTIWRFGGYGGLDENFLAVLRRKGTYRVGGICTCMLFSKLAIEKGANFSWINNLPEDMNGEDRQLSVRCAVNNIYMWADTYFTPQHLEKETYELNKKMLGWKMRRDPKNKISLCMLVHNEEFYLDEFLFKMSPLFDEIVILDTGSEDSTLEIAKKYTDKIYHFEWRDDFSAARNFLIRKATCPWIFYADPDETYQHDKLSHFNEMIKQPDALGYAFIVYNFRKGGQVSLSESVRLFRNSRELYFTGLVHETLDESIGRALKEFPNLKLHLSPIKMYHWGFKKGELAKRKKLAYYKKLDAQQIKERPNDPRGYFNLALHFIEENKREKGEILLKKAISLSDKFMQPRERLSIFYLVESKRLMEESIKGFPPNHPKRRYLEQGQRFLERFLKAGAIVQ